MTDPAAIQRFEVIARLGAGGMGVVYRARDPRLGRDVAIKLLAPRATSRARPPLDTRETIDLRGAAPRGDDLLAEARAMARLSHPNVLPIYEVGVDGAALFLVMEYVVGASLRGWLTAPRTTAEVRAMFAQAARGLAAAHAVGIIHRDFKPDNVLIGEDGRARVADFGLANVVAATAAIEQLAAVAGTPRYMAPELLRGAPAGARSDVFALCRSIADALDGRGDVSAGLRAVVDAGLAEAPEDRPALTAVIAALDTAATVRPRRRWAVAAGLVLAGAVVVAARAPAGAECDAQAAALLPGRWDEVGRAMLRARFPPADAARVIAEVDAKAATFVDAHAAACRAVAAGDLAPDAAAHRRSCLERGAIELGAGVRSALFHPAWPADRVANMMVPGADAINCGDVVEPPVRDVDATTALFGRFVDVAAARGARIDAMAALARDADAAGEPALAVRAQLVLADELRVAGSDDADAVAERAFRGATAIDSGQLVARALLARAHIAIDRDDPTTATRYANLAAAMVDRSTVTPLTRARVDDMLAEAAGLQRDFARELALTADGARVLADTGFDDADMANGFGAMRVEALVGLDRGSDAIAAARDHVAFATRALGSDAPDTAVAHGLLARALDHAGARAEAIAERTVKVALLERELGAANMFTLDARVALAYDLNYAGAHRDALAQLDAVVAAATGDAGSRTRGNARAQRGVIACETGDFDGGSRELAAGIDEVVAAAGADNDEVRESRRTQVAVALERGRIDDAADLVGALAASVRRTHPADEERGRVMTWTARLALARGRAEDAAATARSALSLIGRGDEERADAAIALADAQVAVRRWADARATVAAARADVASPAQRAMLDTIDAEAAAGDGDRATANALARGALAVFASERGYPREAARAARIAGVAAPR